MTMRSIMLACVLCCSGCVAYVPSVAYPPADAYAPPAVYVPSLYIGPPFVVLSPPYWPYGYYRPYRGYYRR